MFCAHSSLDIDGTLPITGPPLSRLLLLATMSDYRAKVSYKPPINIPLGARREVLRRRIGHDPIQMHIMLNPNPENVHDKDKTV